MEKTATLDITPNTETEYETAIEGCLREMERMTFQMAAKQQQIEQLQAETQAMLAELRVG